MVLRGDRAIIITEIFNLYAGNIHEDNKFTLEISLTAIFFFFNTSVTSLTTTKKKRLINLDDSGEPFSGFLRSGFSSIRHVDSLSELVRLFSPPLSLLCRCISNMINGPLLHYSLLHNILPRRCRCAPYNII